MNKKNYILNNASTKYFEYFFLKKLAGAEPAPTPAVEGEGTNFTLEPTSNKRFADVKSKGNTSQQTYTGKNKFGVTGFTDHGVTGTINANGSYTISGKATATGGYIVFKQSNIIPSGTYTMTISKPLPFLVTYSLAQSVAFRFPAGTTSVTLTLSQSYSTAGFYIRTEENAEYNETFDMQIVAGSSSDYEFEPYVGGIPAPNPDYPQAINVVTGTQNVTITNGDDVQNYTLTLGTLELCKIGEYQDYIYKEGDDWYVHKEIRKVILNGSEAWDKNGSYDNGFLVKSSDPSFQHTKYFGGYSNQYTIVNDSTTWQGAGKAGFNNSRVFWLQTIATDYTLQTFKESLSTNNIIVYCVESTAINTKITDATLISNLNTLLNDGYLKKGTNTITTSATGSNLPTIIYIKSN